MPSLLVDGEARPILHVSQIARWLGLPVPQAGGSLASGWDLASTLDRWLELIRPLDVAGLTAPAEPRGRSVRNLTVNVFHPVSLLAEAFASGRFDWDPDGDDERESALATPESVVRYAETIAAAWTSFLLDAERELGSRDPLVVSPRGDVGFAELLASQRWHAAFHREQVEAFVAAYPLRSTAG